MNNMHAALITSSEQLHSMQAAQPLTQSCLTKLQDWQVARLRRTYEDFSLQPRYHDALEFFVNDLYGAHEYSPLKTQLSKVLRMFQQLLPATAMRALALALQLEDLSLSLDVDMVQRLEECDITSSLYQKIYRSVGRIADRRQQILLIVEAGRALDEVMHNPAISAALWATAVPARIIGVARLHDFLRRGHHAFAEMQNANDLLAAIEQRETIIMNNLMNGDSDPFNWQRIHSNASTQSNQNDIARELS